MVSTTTTITSTTTASSTTSTTLPCLATILGSWAFTVGDVTTIYELHTLTTVSGFFVVTGYAPATGHLVRVREFPATEVYDFDLADPSNGPPPGTSVCLSYDFILTSPTTVEGQLQLRFAAEDGGVWSCDATHEYYYPFTGVRVGP